MGLVVEEEMTIIQTQGIIIITEILIEDHLISLGEALMALAEMIHLEAQGEILHKGDFLDLITGVQEFYSLVGQEDLEVQEDQVIQVGLEDHQGI